MRDHLTTEPSTANGQVAVVESFYAAVNAADADAVAAVVDAHFAESVTAEWPASLPYGGTVEGAHRLRRMFVGMAGSDVTIGPGAIEVLSVTGDGQRVAAELAFDWYPPGGSDGVLSGALELWTFEDDRVSSIRAFYWDTAALTAATD